MTITWESIQQFEKELKLNEKEKATISKYTAVLKNLKEWLGKEKLTKESLLKYREALAAHKNAKTVNGYLSAINSYLKFSGEETIKVKFLKVQRQAFLEESRELSETEYRHLLEEAKRQGNERLYLLMMTLCATGIRISELAFITVETAGCGRSDIRMKGKCRTVLLPKELCRKLLAYAKERGIREGYIFRTKNGRAMDRCNIYHELKRLSQSVKVNPKKVFPHNFRHLFARCFYAVEKNLAHLADILGHSRIETTRIYMAVSAREHEKTLKKMRMVV